MGSGYARHVSAKRIEPKDEIDERILTATIALISNLGYDHVRLIDIADHAEVSIGSLQHRFRNRATLLLSAVTLRDRRSRDGLLAAFATLTDPWERLLAQIDHLSRSDGEDAETSYWLELLSAASRNPELFEVMHTQQEYWLEAVHSNLGEGLDSGRLRSDMPAQELATAILALIDGLFASRAFGDRYRDPDWVRGLILQIVGSLVQPVD